MKLFSDPKFFVRAAEADAHNKLQHTENGNIDRENLASFYARSWVGMDLSKTKSVAPRVNPAHGLYPAKIVRRGDGTAFPMPEIAGTIYAAAPRVIRPRINFGTFSQLVTSDVLTLILTEMENPGTRSGLINPRKESGQFSVIENGALIAPMIGRHYRSLPCDIRPMLMNVAIYEFARVLVTDVIGDFTVAELPVSAPTRVTTMPPRTGQYFCMKATDFINSFDTCRVRVGGGIWTMGDCTVIFIESSETPLEVQATMWVESHLPWCVKVEDTYMMPGPLGVMPAATVAKKAILNLSYVENNAEVIESKVILVATDRTATQLRIGGTVVNVQVPARGTPYVLSPLYALRQANLISLTASGVDLVQLYDRSMRSHTVVLLPWNQVFSILAATTVDFYHPSSTVAVSPFHQLVSSDECRWEQGSWSTIAEMALLTDFCKIEHPNSSYLNPSHHDQKIGALNILRLVESILDASELNDDLVNYGDIIVQMNNIERRLFQIFEIARSQGVKMNIDANIRSGTTVCTHYRWPLPIVIGSKISMQGILELPVIKWIGVRGPGPLVSFGILCIILLILTVNINVVCQRGFSITSYFSFL